MDPNEIYFRMCWMTLKSEASARLRSRMDAVEIKLCGLTKLKLLNLEKKKHERSPDIRPV